MERTPALPTFIRNQETKIEKEAHPNQSRRATNIVGFCPRNCGYASQRLRISAPQEANSVIIHLKKQLVDALGTNIDERLIQLSIPRSENPCQDINN
jgi:hypothetical protein